MFEKSKHCVLMQLEKILCICAVVVACFVPATAFADGNVDISLTVPPYEDGEVSIGKQVYRDFKIENQGQDVYVRMQAHISLEDTPDAVVFDDLDSYKWIAKPDGWIYLTEPLNQNETKDLLNTFMITGDESFFIDLQNPWELTFTETATAQAIASISVNPNWASDNPWGDAYDRVDQSQKQEVSLEAGIGLAQTGDDLDYWFPYCLILLAMVGIFAGIVLEAVLGARGASL